MTKKQMYKLVSQDYTTHGGTKWESGKKVVANGIGAEMCTDQVLHCYSSPYLAILFNPIHADIHNPRLIAVSCSKIIASDGLKFACKEQTMLKEIPCPRISALQSTEFAIRVAMLQYMGRDFVRWAKNWLSGIDRTFSAAQSAARSAQFAAQFAAQPAQSAAQFAAESAAQSAAKFKEIINEIMER